MNLEPSLTVGVPRSLDPRERAAWWAIALRGLLAILFGVIALTNPSAAAIALVIVFAIWALSDAAFAIAVAAQRGRAGQPWGWFAFEGIASIAAAVFALVYPSATILVLTIVVAVRALVLGVLTIGGALAWKDAPWRWMLAVTGVVSVLFGLLLLWQPLVGAIALVWTIGVYAIVLGFLMLALAIHVHGLERGIPQRPIEAGR
jgi:uncharacterized membrane protein HdeD (DUF308 family)